MPPGIPPAMAIEFMARLNGGGTIRKLTGGGKRLGPAFVTYDRFKKHCALNPEWAVEAWRISKINGNAGKGALNRNRTHCVNGHSLAQHGRAAFREGFHTRMCRECEKMRYHRGDLIKPDVLVKVTARINAGSSISSCTKAGNAGYLVRFSTLARYRRENPEFDRFIVECARSPHARSQLMHFRIVPDNSSFFSLTDPREEIPPFEMQPGDYEWIMSFISRRFPEDVRMDIAQDVLEALLRRAISRQQVKGRIIDFVSKHRKAVGNPDYNASLDAPLIPDGTLTRMDAISFDRWKNEIE